MTSRNHGHRYLAALVRRLAICLSLTSLLATLALAVVGPEVAGATAFTPDGGALPSISSAGGGDPSGADCHCTGVDPNSTALINNSTGDVYDTTTDLSVPGEGVPLSLSSTYSSIVAQNEKANGLPAGSLGYGWSDNLGMSVSQNTTTHVVTITQEDGSQVVFNYYAIGTSEPGWCPTDTSVAVYCVTAPRSIATLAYNSSSSTWTFVRSVTGPITFTFNSTGSTGQLTQEEDATGDTITSSAGTVGSGECPSSAATCKVWTSSVSGRTITLAFNTGGALLSATDEAGNSTTFCDFGQACAPSSGGQSGDLASMTRYSGTSAAQTTSYTYDVSNSNANYQHDMLTLVPPGGGSTDETTNTYDTTDGRASTQTLPGGASYAFSYSGSSYTADNGSSTGGTTTVKYYPNGTGSGEPNTTNTYAYTDGVLQSETVETNGTYPTETFSPDPSSLLSTSTTNLDDNSSSATIADTSGGTSSPAANVVTSTDQDGNTTAQAYTAANLPWCKVAPAEYAYGVTCPGSEPTGPPAWNGTYAYPGVSLTFYNSAGQVSATTDALGNTTVNSYTTSGSGVPVGLLYCTVDPVNYRKDVTCPAYGAAHVTGTQTSTFDSAGDQLTSTNADGDTTTYTYNSSGLVHTTTDPDGTVTTDTYNGANQVTQEVQSFGDVFGYNAQCL